MQSKTSLSHVTASQQSVNNPSNNKIFVSCNASDKCTGAILMYGPTKVQAQLVAFDSMQLKGAELKHPVHEKELYAIIWALKKWRVDLLEGVVMKVSSLAGVPWLPDNAELVGALMVAPVNVLRIATDPTWIQRIKEGYKADTWYRKLSEAKGFSGIRKENGLWYVGTRLMIPRVQDIRKGLFHLAHDARGHFGFDKSYAALQDSYYWPNMQKEIETLYIPSCEHCQWNKSSTCKLTGPLHPLPVPNNHRDSVATDFIGPLPEDSGFNIIATFTNCLGADIRLVPTRMDITPEDFAVIFFNNWYCENGLPLEIVLDRDHIFPTTLKQMVPVNTPTRQSYKSSGIMSHRIRKTGLLPYPK
ncbi:hypothetical protein NLI96_g10568 [Meripilus lineatus]|uniref:Polyprotein n=1 Tax=Meripilus lineatus TaxID=2056292 RepID=A0AAD5UTN7_9APHY|nr:hypothetical protein NLI96_g10568 [Physisporinus lineatus]